VTARIPTPEERRELAELFRRLGKAMDARDAMADWAEQDDEDRASGELDREIEGWHRHGPGLLAALDLAVKALEDVAEQKVGGGYRCRLCSTPGRFHHPTCRAGVALAKLRGEGGS
jgi:hypothetical protein